MKDEVFLEMMEQAAEKLGIKLGYEDLRKGEVSTQGGLFVLKGEKRILVHKGLAARERADVLVEIFSALDTEGVHLPPDVREAIDSAKGA